MTYCNREECFGIICIIYISQLRKVDCTVLVINLCKKFTNTLDNPSLKSRATVAWFSQRGRPSVTRWSRCIPCRGTCSMTPSQGTDCSILTVGLPRSAKQSRLWNSPPKARITEPRRGLRSSTTCQN